MNITRRSPLTGREATMDLPVTEAQLAAWTDRKVLIQVAMPQLTDEEREFIMTGYTPEDWAAMFPPEEEAA